MLSAGEYHICLLCTLQHGPPPILSVCSVYVNILLQAFQGLLWRSMSMLLSLYSYIFPADVPFLHFIQILCIWKLLATQWLQKQLPTTIVKYQNKGGQNQLFVLNSDISELCFPFCTDKSSLLICIKLITPLWSHVVAKPNEKIQWWVLLFMSNVICALSSGGFQ